MRPRPRTSSTTGRRPAIARSPSKSCRPRRRTASSRPSSSTASRKARARRQGSGPPPKVEPWAPGPKSAADSSGPSSAPSGRPAASGFASVIRSGATPACRQADQAPVRPRPHWTSSAIRSAPASSQAARAAARTAGSTGRTPPSPWIGSRITAAVSGPTAERSAAASSGGTKATPPTRGPNGARYFGCPVADSAKAVRPWNEPSRATIPVAPSPFSRRARARASFSAASTASEPLLQKKTRGRPKSAARRAASGP